MGSGLRRVGILFLYTLILLACWLWWESYACTVDWAKRSDPFPLPFYLASIPHWAAVDLAIALIVGCSFALAYLAWGEAG